MTPLLYAGKVFAVGTVSIIVGQRVTEMAQRVVGDRDIVSYLRKLIIGQSVGCLLRPNPDRVAGKLADHIDRSRSSSRITRQVEILPHKVRNAAVGDSVFVRQNIPAELRAAGEIDSAALDQIDACTLLGVYNRAALRRIAVLGKLRAAAEVQSHSVQQVDRAALIGIAGADDSAVVDIEIAAARRHMDCAAKARGCAGVDGGCADGERIIQAVDRAAATVCASGCGAIFKGGAGDCGRRASDAALTVQRAAVIGGGAICKQRGIAHLNRFCPGKY